MDKKFFVHEEEKVVMFLLLATQIDSKMCAEKASITTSHEEMLV
jgi:hypothetical protein